MRVWEERAKALGRSREFNHQGRGMDFQSVRQLRTDWKSVLRVDGRLHYVTIRRFEPLSKFARDF